MREDVMLSAQRAVIVFAVTGSALVIWPSETAAYGLPKATLVVVAAIAALGVAAGRSLIWRRIEVPLAPAVWAAVAVVVAMLVAVVSSNTPMVALMGTGRQTGLISYLAYFVLALAAASSFRQGGIVLLARSVAVGASVVALYGLAQALGWQPVPFGILTVPVFSTLGNSNFLSGWLALAVPLVALAAIRESSMLRRVVLWGLAALCLVVIVASRSAQGIPALAAGGAVLLAVLASQGARWSVLRGGQDPSSRRRLIGLAVLSGLAGLAALILVIPQFAGGLAPRLDYWSAAARVIADNPVVGVGPDTFEQFYPSYYQPVSGIGYEATDNPHSVPLTMFVSGGALLGVAYLVLTVLTAWALWKGLRRSSGPDQIALGAIGGAWVAYQVQSLVSIDVPPLAVFNWVLIGLILSRSGGLRMVTLGRAQLPRPSRAERRRGDSPVRVGSGARIGIALVALAALILAWNALRPMRAVSAADRAQSLIGEGNGQGALQASETAVRLAPWQARNWFVRGRVLERTGELQEARAAARRAALLDRGNVAYALVVAELAQQANDHDVALDWFERAVEADPRDGRAYVAMARALILYDQRDRALEILERELAKSPTAELWGLKGRAHVLDGETGLAIEAYEEALKLDPSHGEAKGYLRRD